MKSYRFFILLVSISLFSTTASAASIQNGLNELKQFFETDDPQYMASANAEFKAVLASTPSNYSARVYSAFTELGDLVNDTDLNDLMGQFGFEYMDMGGMDGWGVTGKVDVVTAPLPNSAVDTVWERVHPEIDDAYDMLAAIPSSWAGSVEISTNYFPVDTTVYVDYADVVAAKAALKSLRSFLNTIRAYDMTVDYEDLEWPASLPTATITVDGSSADWSAIPVQLVGEEGDALTSIKAAQNGIMLYVLLEKADFIDGWTFGSWFDVLAKTTGVEDWLECECYDWGDGVNASLWVGDVEVFGAVATNGNYIEMSFTVPELTDAGIIEAAGLYANSPDYPFHEYSELEFPLNHPASSLLATYPDVLNSVRDASALTQAKADLLQALTLAQDAGPLITNRTDAQLHFLEYDPVDAADYDELMVHIATIKDSLSSPQLIAADDGLNDFDLYLGAFYSEPYLTRSMLPAYATEALFIDPTPGTFPDPTFAGIFPELTQGSISAGLAGYPLNVPVLTGVVASQSTSLSKIDISWNPIEGATDYEIWRSTSPNLNGATPVATVSGGSYTDSSLEPGSTYYYWVRGTNPYQVGAFNIVPLIGTTRPRQAMPWLNLLLD